ncbi:type II toxin-antitoxin system PemK/MazF family toxin [Plantactinospora siamensis]|uniref:Type II toxin-antitoxin system PemK/MazF family toxin n=1 Tax=Plantactinospora siamensis TaxID=555372 RepID=A0ABV6NRI8_9ACTN
MIGRGSAPTGGSVPAQRGRPAPARPARERQVAALQRRQLSYAPEPDGRADPGEVVWTWVPYEDDPRQGKDRPVLVVGRQSRTLYGLMLSSQSERDGQRNWLALGPGSWDRENRPSWIRLDRVLTMREDSIRREGAVLDRARFDRVSAALRSDHGWS